MPGPAAKSSSDSKNEKGKKGKKRDPLELPFLASLRETYRVCCTGRGIRPHMPLLALIDDLSSQVAPLEKAVVVSPDPDFSPLSAEAVVDAISGYPKCKNLAFWGCHIGDSGMSSVASLIAASADSFTCGARLLLFELVGGDSNQYNPGQSANGGMGPESIVDTLLPLTSSKEVESDKADLVQGYSLNTLEKLSSALSIRGCQLKALQLSNINLGDTGLKILYRGLVSSANLKRLTLAYNNLTPASAVILSLLLYKYENPPSALSLTELDLQGNSLGVEILEELAKVLGENKSLAFLNLDNNCITDNPDIASRFANALIANGTKGGEGEARSLGALSSISMNHNVLGNKTAAELLRALENNQQIKRFRIPSKLDRQIASRWKDILVKRNAKKKKAKKVLNTRKGLRKR